MNLSPVARISRAVLGEGQMPSSSTHRVNCGPGAAQPPPAHIPPLNGGDGLMPVGWCRGSACDLPTGWPAPLPGASLSAVTLRSLPFTLPRGLQNGPLGSLRASRKLEMQGRERGDNYWPGRRRTAAPSRVIWSLPWCYRGPVCADLFLVWILEMKRSKSSEMCVPACTQSLNPYEPKWTQFDFPLSKLIKYVL